MNCVMFYTRKVHSVSFDGSFYSSDKHNIRVMKHSLSQTSRSFHFIGTKYARSNVPAIIVYLEFSYA